MDDKENSILKNEIATLAKECRLYAKGARTDLSLMRVAARLDSMLASLDEAGLSPENPLTKREKEVLELVALGYTNGEIASALKLSVKTIEYHLGLIFKKTEASKRTESVANALKFKWLGQS